MRRLTMEHSIFLAAHDVGVGPPPFPVYMHIGAITEKALSLVTTNLLMVGLREGLPLQILKVLQKFVV